MEEATPKEIFLISLNRCLAQDSFIPTFYEKFLASSEEVRKKFRFTDFEKQSKMLARSLQLSAGATSGDVESLREISERAKTHDRYHFDIKPHLYDLWLDTLIATAQDIDELWDEKTEASWRKILGFVIQHMVKRY